jgi:hypothetical protein
MNVIACMILLLAFGFSTAQGQPPSAEKRKERIEKIKAYKREFIQQELELTADEEVGFWKVYDEFELKRDELRKEHHQLREKFRGKKPEEFSEAEAEEILANEMLMKEKRLKLDKEYDAALKGVIPATKILKLHRLERQFKRKLLQKMGDHKGPRGGHSHPPHDDTRFED